jgi:adenine-specific DNA-methyltransferase
LDRILRLSTGPDDLVLDFFAGSGTTAHAVMKLNSEDGGRRRFILVSSTEATAADPDKNLCRDVCARRVRRVIEGYGDTPGLGGGFAYLRSRRIPPGGLVELDHAQVWTALQLIHRGSIEPFTGADFLQAGDAESALFYVPRFTAALVPPLREAVSRTASAALYSWQPETLRQHIRAAHVEHGAIPESLARRFQLKA